MDEPYISYTSGAAWSRFTVDALAGEESGVCVECSATLHAGWMCLDVGGMEMCERCHAKMRRSDARCRRVDEKYKRDSRPWGGEGQA